MGRKSELAIAHIVLMAPNFEIVAAVIKCVVIIMVDFFALWRTHDESVHIKSRAFAVRLLDPGRRIIPAHWIRRSVPLKRSDEWSIFIIDDCYPPPAENNFRHMNYPP